MMPKFRIADLLVLVLFAGLVAFTFRYEGLYLVVLPVGFLGSVCVATAGRLYRQGPRRAAWNTFALFGWAIIGFIIMFMNSGGGFDEMEFVVICVIGFLGASFSAYVAGRLVPRDEPDSPSV